MGCLPLIVLWLVGTGIGYLVDGAAGALWGSGIGLLAGIASAFAFVMWLRRTQRWEARGAPRCDGDQPPR